MKIIFNFKKFKNYQKSNLNGKTFKNNKINKFLKPRIQEIKYLNVMSAFQSSC